MLHFAKNEFIEYSLRNSRSLLLREILTSNSDDLPLSVERLVNVKQASKSKNAVEFKRDLLPRLEQIVGYERLKDQIEIERTNFYDSENESHEEALLQLWKLLMPETPLTSRISNQWPDVGFQGDDPATDFRGMGLLGLNQLVYLSTAHNDVAIRMMRQSAHPTKGYPFAIVGISMTSLLRDLLKENYLKKQFSMHCAGIPKLEEFNRIYCKIFISFDNFWYGSNPASIMDYVPLRTKFYNNLIAEVDSDEDVFELRA